MKKYYIITEGPKAEEIYGNQYPVCMDETEVKRLSQEWNEDLFEVMHEATPAELEQYGTYNSSVFLNGHEVNFEAAVELMDDEIREELHGEGIETEQAFLDAYSRRHFEKYGKEFTV